MIERNRLHVDPGESPLKKLREMLGMSQQEFASHLGLSIATVSRWERGLGQPVFTIGQVRKLLEALKPHGYDLDDLPDDLSLRTNPQT